MKRKGLIRAAVAAGAALATVAVASPAQASQDVTVHVLQCPMAYCATAGYGWFHADPVGSTPGDALKACDLDADGYGVKAWLYNRNTGNLIRTASTAGHSSPYCTGWQTGDLPEQTPVWLKVCKVSSTKADVCATGAEGWS
ncbi:hypothetical protein Nm8I071_60990 [Nonomuraea sp. TT08I-71]|nr:hypothetical protein Nm8I071_60990 [Nonomuraea sp. TT08I-71]